MKFYTISLSKEEIEDSAKDLAAFFTLRDLERGRRARVLQRFGQAMAVAAYAAETDADLVE